MPLLDGFTSKAYLIGVTNYTPPVKPLRSPVNDITALKNCLKDFGNDNILCCPDPDKAGFTAFLDRIEAEVNDDANPANRVLIYFAGHGKSIYDKTNTPKGYLLLRNNNGEDFGQYSYALEELVGRLNRLHCRHLLLILDCCFAGAVNWVVNTRFSGSENADTIRNKMLNLYINNKAWHIITSSTNNQESVDVIGTGERDINKTDLHSPFATVLMNALNGKSWRQYFADGVITSRKLHIYLMDELHLYLEQKNVVHDQLPGFFTMNQDRQGQFLFPVYENGTLQPHREDTNFTHKNPYKGFTYYTKEDTDYFFGRENYIEAFAAEIKSSPSSDFIVTGASGCGKSSLVRAGFIPQLISAGGTGLHDENIHSISISQYAQLDLKELEKRAGESITQVIFLDQFEEILPMAEKQPGSVSDVNSIIELATAHDTIYLFIGIRSDRKREVYELPGLNIKDKNLKEIIVTHPSTAEIEDIIVKPALRQAAVIRANPNIANGANADRALVDEIKSDYSDPGTLPFLSTALHNWFELSVGQNDEPRIMNGAVWRQYPGIASVFAEKLKEARRQFPGDFEMLMFRLVDYYNGNPIRRKVTKASIGFNNDEQLERLLKYLQNNYILQRLENTEVYELAHDRIIEYWLKDQPFFVQRQNKETVIPAQHELTEDAMKAQHNYWINTKELNLLSTEFEETGKVNFLQNSLSIFSKKAVIYEKPHFVKEKKENKEETKTPVEYYTDKEKNFLNKSIGISRFKKRGGIRVMGGISLVLIAGIILFMWQFLEAKKQARRNLAKTYAERSLNVGETEALYLLKVADSLSDGADSSITKKLYALLNPKSHIGFPFAKSIMPEIPGLHKKFYDSKKNNIVLYNDCGDSAIWDYKNNRVEKKLTPEYSSRIKNTRAEGKRIFFETSKPDTINLDYAMGIDYELSKNLDSIFIIVSDEQIHLYYIYSAYTKQLQLMFEVDNLAGIRFSKTGKYIYYGQNDSLFLYTRELKEVKKIELPYDRNTNAFLLDFNPDDSKMAYTDYERGEPILKLLEMNTRHITNTNIRVYEGVKFVAENTIAAHIQNEQTFSTYNIETGDIQEIADFSDDKFKHLHLDAIQKEGDIIFFSGGRDYVEDSIYAIDTSGNLFSFKMNPSGFNSSQDGKYVLSSYKDGGLVKNRLFDISNLSSPIMAFTSTALPAGGRFDVFGNNMILRTGNYYYLFDISPLPVLQPEENKMYLRYGKLKELEIDSVRNFYENAPNLYIEDLTGKIIDSIALGKKDSSYYYSLDDIYFTPFENKLYGRFSRSNTLGTEPDSTFLFVWDLNLHKMSIIFQPYNTANYFLVNDYLALSVNNTVCFFNLKNNVEENKLTFYEFRDPWIKLLSDHFHYSIAETGQSESEKNSDTLIYILPFKLKKYLNSLPDCRFDYLTPELNKM